MHDFVHVVETIYHGNLYYVPDLYSDIRAMFNPRKNKAMAFCDIQPFVAYQGGRCVGRIAGIINHRANEKWRTPTVRFGYIEFIDNFLVAEALLNAVEQWGLEHGMSVAQGPMGITDFDKEGMLVEDFHLNGSMTAIYNLPYYPTFMEALGYQKAVDWLQMRVMVPDEFPAKYTRVARYARENERLTVRSMTRREMKGETGLKAFQLLNGCYQYLFGFVEFTAEQMHDFISRYALLIDCEMILIIENAQSEVVGTAVSMNSLAEALQRSRGRLFPFGWWHLWKALRWKRSSMAELLLIAVRFDYQGKGASALFFEKMMEIYRRRHILWAETGPTLEDNLAALSQWKAFRPQMVKRRRCYTKDLT